MDRTLEERISKIIAEKKLEWEKFITVDLGYTQEQGEKFANGFISELEKLPIFEKLDALKKVGDPLNQCMSAGFKAAGIDKNEAFKRFTNRE